MCALDDEETQINGLIVLFFHMGAPDHPEKMNDHGLIWQLGASLRVLPFRLKGMHVCTDDPAIKMLFGLMTSASSRQIKRRLKLHFGM